MPSKVYAVTCYNTPDGVPKVIYGRIQDECLDNCENSFILVECTICQNGAWEKIEMAFYKNEVRIVPLEPKSTIFFDEDTHLAFEIKL